MPDAFFASTSKKRKRTSRDAAARSYKSKGPLPPKKVPKKRDEELLSDATHSDVDDVDLRASDIDSAASDRDEDVRETPAEKRLRLAKIYLDSVKEGLSRGEGEFDAEEVDRDIISARLKEDVLENAGRLHVFIAESLGAGVPHARRLRIKGHRLAVTSALVSHDADRLFMAGKEGGVSSWDLSSGKRVSYSPKRRSQPPTTGAGQSKKGKGKASLGDIAGHTDEVLALALSGDGRYLVSGGKDRIVGVWDVSDDEHTADDASPKGLVWVKGFSGHKDTVSALSFRKSSNMLYTASTDRTIKLFDLTPGVMGYVETLFGHQDAVTGLDSLKGDTAVSCGARDRTCRFWKIADETQLVFRGGGAGKMRARDILEGVLDEEDPEPEKMQKAAKGKMKEERWVEGSVDCIAMVDENTFVSGGDSGTIALWSTAKKKPVFSQNAAHGLEEVESSTEGRLRRPRWITSIACLRYSDLFASGSWDGTIRLWKLEPSLRSFSYLGPLPALGLINSLQLVLIPKGWSRDHSWDPTTVPHDSETAGLSNGVASLPNGLPKKSAPPVRNDDGVLLVAGVGQEPRLGRWIRMKGEGVVNAAMIFSLRKSSS